MQNVIHIIKTHYIPNYFLSHLVNTLSSLKISHSLFTFQQEQELKKMKKLRKEGDLPCSILSHTRSLSTPLLHHPELSLSPHLQSSSKSAQAHAIGGGSKSVVTTTAHRSSWGTISSKGWGKLDGSVEHLTESNSSLAKTDPPLDEAEQQVAAQQSQSQ